MTEERAQDIAIAALAHLASDATLLERFLRLTGLTQQTIRSAAHEPGFLASVLQFYMQDERLLMAFAQARDLRPETLTRAHATLAGPPEENWT